MIPGKQRGELHNSLKVFSPSAPLLLPSYWAAKPWQLSALHPNSRAQIRFPLVILNYLVNALKIEINYFWAVYPLTLSFIPSLHTIITETINLMIGVGKSMEFRNNNSCLTLWYQSNPAYKKSDFPDACGRQRWEHEPRRVILSCTYAKNLRYLKTKSVAQNLILSFSHQAMNTCRNFTHLTDSIFYKGIKALLLKIIHVHTSACCSLKSTNIMWHSRPFQIPSI